MATFLDLLLQDATETLALVNARTGKVVATQLQTAFDSAARRKGLLGRTSMPSDAALLIAPCNGVHTFFMRFPIDVVFAARDGRVVKVCHGVLPWRLALAFSAFATVELAAGAASAAHVQRNDHLVLDIRLHIE
jgi:hypothetical protein